MEPIPPNSNDEALPSLPSSSEVGSGSAVLDSHWRAMFEMQQKTMMELIETIRTPPKISLPEINPEQPDVDPRAWCATVDICLEERPLEGASLIIALSKALKGSASSWLSQISHAGMTWKHFRELFLARYDSTETLAATLINLNNGQPKEGECLAAYASRLMTALLARWKNLSHEEIATSYVLAHVAQFDSRLNRLAFTSEIATRTKLLQEIKASVSFKRELDHNDTLVGRGDGSEAKRFKPQVSTASMTCYKCGKPGHIAVSCLSKSTKHARSSVNKTMVVTTLDSMRKVTCYLCGIKGHKAKKCCRGKAMQLTGSVGNAAVVEPHDHSCEITCDCGKLKDES